MIAIPAELTQVVENNEEKIRELRVEASKLDEAEAEVKRKQDEVKRRVEAHFNRVAEEGKRLEQLKKVMGGCAVAMQTSFQPTDLWCCRRTVAISPCIANGSR